MTDNYDHTWKNPSEAQRAALTHVYKHLGQKQPKLTPPIDDHFMLMSMLEDAARRVDLDMPVNSTNPYTLADMMCTAKDSFWYRQATSWAGGHIANYAGDTGILIEAGKAICTIVDWGYQDGKWWDLEQIYPDEKMRVLASVQVIEIGRIMGHMRVHSLMIHSAMFEHYLPTLIVHPKTQIAKVKRALAFQPRLAIALCAAPYSPKVRQTLKDLRTRPCIDPACTKGENGGPAITTSQSGACCREHMNFECTHPTCVARATRAGWKRATHPFGSKIATAHLAYRKQEQNQ